MVECCVAWRDGERARRMKNSMARTAEAMSAGMMKPKRKVAALAPTPS